MNSQEILSTTKLDWTVRTEEIQTVSGIEIPKKLAIVREDNGKILGVHGDGYVPYQNIELMELLHNISKSTGLQIHSSGEFGGGEKVWIQLKSDDLKIGNDRVEGFLSGINSFDGSTNLSFGNANLTISCQNSFWMGYRQMKTKFRHSATMKARIDEILFDLDKLLKEEKQVFEHIIQMSEVQVNPTIIDLVKKKLFQLEVEDHILKIDDISTRKQNQIIRFEMDIDSEMKDKGDNLWGLFSGITKYTTHNATKDLTKNQENKMFGRMGMIERNMFHELHSLV